MSAAVEVGLLNIRVKTMDSKEHRVQMKPEASITEMK
jgi:hypothetical protein